MAQKRNPGKWEAYQIARNALRRGDAGPMDEYRRRQWNPRPRGMLTVQEYAKKHGVRSISQVHYWYNQGRLPGAIMLPQYGTMGPLMIWIPGKCPRPKRYERK